MVLHRDVFRFFGCTVMVFGECFCGSRTNFRVSRTVTVCEDGLRQVAFGPRTSARGTRTRSRDWVKWKETFLESEKNGKDDTIK